MYKEVKLVEKVIADGSVSLIAEVNVYNGDILYQQDSRSPFVFPDTMTDQEIVEYLIANEYAKYF